MSQISCSHASTAGWAVDIPCPGKSLFGSRGKSLHTHLSAGALSWFKLDDVPRLMKSKVLVVQKQDCKEFFGSVTVSKRFGNIAKLQDMENGILKPCFSCRTRAGQQKSDECNFVGECAITAVEIVVV
jgi:hypothetical protein